MIPRRAKELHMLRRQHKEARDRGAVRSAERDTRSTTRGRTQDPALKSKFQNDLGFMATGEQADYVRGQIKEQRERYDKGMGDVNKAKGQLSAFERENLKTLDGLWNDAQSQMVTVDVYTNNKKEGSYKLPREVVDSFQGNLTMGGDGTYPAKWANDNTYNIDTKVSTLDEVRGKELHQMLGDARSTVKTEFYAQAGPKVAESNTTVRNTVGEAEGQIGGAEDALKGAWDLTESQVAKKAEEYQTIKKGAAFGASTLGRKGGI